MTDKMIRLSDALAKIHWLSNADWTKAERRAAAAISEAIAALPVVTEAYAEDLEAKLAKAVDALRKLHHAVCGETGFAACVRLESGLAYPWPALDEADEMTRTTLAEIEGKKDD